MTAFGYQIAKQFAVPVWPVRPGLVPLTLPPEAHQWMSLSGISINALVSNGQRTFLENILFTHRGLSGPAILQISSYWQAGEMINIDMLPGINLFENLKKIKIQQPNKMLHSVLAEYLPKRMIDCLLNEDIALKKLADTNYNELKKAAEIIHQFRIIPNGTEGYRTAEVTIGGVDCSALSSKTMETKTVPGLYFIGEVVDVTGWLGGFNFQWAWSSGWAAGQYV